MADLSSITESSYDNDNLVQTDNQQISENTFLIINETSNFNKFYVGFLLIIFITGSSIGGYLLITQGREWKAQGKYNFISRKDWKAHVPISPIPLMQVPVKKVLFLQIDSSNGCVGEFDCSKLIHELQLKEMFELNRPDVGYNFVVVNEFIYEGRNWRLQSGVADNQTVTLAIIGTNPEISPTVEQINQIKLFLDIAISRNILIPCYQLLIKDQGRFLIDLEFHVRQQVLIGCNGKYV